MFEIGRLCVKLAGREAGKKCVIVDVMDDKFVVIDGDVRRKKCNIKHLEPLGQTLGITKGAAHEAVVKEFKSLGIELTEKKQKAAKAAKPVKQRKSKKEEKTAETAAAGAKGAKAKKPKQEKKELLQKAKLGGYLPF